MRTSRRFARSISIRGAPSSARPKPRRAAKAEASRTRGGRRRARADAADRLDRSRVALARRRRRASRAARRARRRTELGGAARRARRAARARGRRARGRGRAARDASWRRSSRRCSSAASCATTALDGRAAPTAGGGGERGDDIAGLGRDRSPRSSRSTGPASRTRTTDGRAVHARRQRSDCTASRSICATIRVPHFHFVTYGFTDLFVKETDDPEVERLRLRADAAAARARPTRPTSDVGAQLPAEPRALRVRHRQPVRGRPQDGPQRSDRARPRHAADRDPVRRGSRARRDRVAVRQGAVHPGRRHHRRRVQADPGMVDDRPRRDPAQASCRSSSPTRSRPRCSPIRRSPRRSHGASTRRARRRS